MQSMPARFLRIYKKFYLDEVKAHLMSYGALSGICANCRHMDVKLEDLKCPGCSTEFKYIAFQHIKDHLPKMLRVADQRPTIIFVDHDDFKRLEGEERAKGILG